MEFPTPDEARDPEAYTYPVDNSPGTLWDEAKADKAAGRPTWSTRGAADIPPEDR